MKKILVIQQKMIGDVLVGTVICDALKAQYPEAIIHYMAYKDTLPVIQHHESIDKIITLTEEDRPFFKLYAFAKALRHEKYDILIDAYGKLETQLISLFSRIPERISFKKWYTGFFYTKQIERKGHVLTAAGNAIENRLRLVCSEDEIVSYANPPTIRLSSKERQEALDFLVNHQIDLKLPVVMISILGSSADKSLPDSSMALVLDDIVANMRGTLLFNYIPSQKEDVERIYKLTKPETQENIRMDVYAKSLRGFLALTKHCTALIGNEGGAVNMAKALNIPTYTIFSPWIRKDAWNMFEDGKKHISVHLSDFEPELYSGDTAKDLKPQAFELYKKLTPERIKPSLVKFLTIHLKE